MTKPATSCTWDNSQYCLFTLQNQHQTQIIISDYGATIIEINTKDRHQETANIVLGFATLKQYQENDSYLGATIGPWANRIDGGQFELDGHNVQLECNETSNHLHGASAGFNTKKWRLIKHTNDMLILEHTSTAGEAGYDATLNVTLSFMLDNQDRLSIKYLVTTDRACPVNLTNHSYFNLDPQACDIWQHQLHIDADKYLETNQQSIPIAINSALDSPFDFTAQRAVTYRGEKHNIDHSFCLRKNIESELPGLFYAATLYEKRTARSVMIETTEAAVQLYTAEHLADFTDRSGRKCSANAGLCLETQLYPDAVNSVHQQSAILKPAHTYYQLTRFTFNQSLKE